MHRLVWDSVCKSPWKISEMGQRRICTAATRYQNNKIRFQLRSLIFIQTRTTQEHSTRRIPSVLLITKGWITNHQVLKFGTGRTTSFRPLISPILPQQTAVLRGYKNTRRVHSPSRGVRLHEYLFRRRWHEDPYNDGQLQPIAASGWEELMKGWRGEANEGGSHQNHTVSSSSTAQVTGFVAQALRTCERLLFFF